MWLFRNTLTSFKAIAVSRTDNAHFSLRNAYVVLVLVSVLPRFSIQTLLRLLARSFRFKTQQKTSLFCSDVKLMMGLFQPISLNCVLVSPSYRWQHRRFLVCFMSLKLCGLCRNQAIIYIWSGNMYCVRSVQFIRHLNAEHWFQPNLVIVKGPTGIAQSV